MSQIKRRRKPARLHDQALNIRRKMVAEAAYYQAERRGFTPGYELTDWLEAEKEVNAIVSNNIL